MDLIVHCVDTFVFSGGGPKAGPLFVGAVDALLERLPSLNYCDTDSTVKRVRGTSCGSMMAFMVSMRVATKDMIQVMQPLSDQKLFEWLPIHLVKDHGLNNGEGLQNVLHDISKKYCGHNDPTFAQLHEITGMTLEIVVTDIDESVRGAVILSHVTHPDISVIEAVMASSAIPIMFIPRKLKVVGDEEHLCVDGGVAANFCLTDLDPERTLGFYCVHKLDDTQAEENQDSSVTSLSKFLRYSEQLIRTTMKLGDTDPGNVPTIVVNSGDPRMTVFHIGAVARAELISTGFRSTNKFLDTVNIVGKTRDAATQTLHLQSQETAEVHAEEHEAVPDLGTSSGPDASSLPDASSKSDPGRVMGERLHFGCTHGFA